MVNQFIVRWFMSLRTLPQAKYRLLHLAAELIMTQTTMVNDRETGYLLMLKNRKEFWGFLSFLMNIQYCTAGVIINYIKQVGER
jgi:hypothetical protein